jgi:hypothetical protein
MTTTQATHYVVVCAACGKDGLSPLQTDLDVSLRAVRAFERAGGTRTLTRATGPMAATTNGPTAAVGGTARRVCGGGRRSLVRADRERKRRQASVPELEPLGLCRQLVECVQVVPWSSGRPGSSEEASLPCRCERLSQE